MPAFQIITDAHHVARVPLADVRRALQLAPALALEAATRARAFTPRGRLLVAARHQASVHLCSFAEALAELLT